MRDHPAHSIEVLGSGWGVRMSQLERSFIDAGFMTAVKDPIFWAPRGAYGPDQGFLKRYFLLFLEYVHISVQKEWYYIIRYFLSM